MVIFLTLPEGTGHIDAFRHRFGAGSRRRIGEITYHELLRRGSAQGAAYVFTDRERMTLPQRRIATAIWDQIMDAGPGFRAINHPMRQLGRYELLRKLHEAGVNRYRAHPLPELPDDIRYPVFIRLECDHNGPRTGLIGNADELKRESDRLILLGLDPAGLLVIEFEDTADEMGLYHKRGILYADGVAVSNHIYSSQGWNVKSAGANKTQEQRESSNLFFNSGADQELVLPFFELANIQYGRIDYYHEQGQVQVWEINDNPSLLGGNPEYCELRQDAWMAALESFGKDLPSASPIPISLDETCLWEAIRT